MAADQVLNDSLSLDGIRRLHILQMGSPVDLSRWIGRVPVVCEGMLARTSWVEEALGVWHLLLVWRARELVTLQAPGMAGLPAVMWGIDRMVRRSKDGKRHGPQTVRQAIDEAACYFELMTGELANLAIVSSYYGAMVAGIKERVNGEPVYSMRWEHPDRGRGANELAMRTADWMAAGSVVIYKGGDR